MDSFVHLENNRSFELLFNPIHNRHRSSGTSLTHWPKEELLFPGVQTQSDVELQSNVKKQESIESELDTGSCLYRGTCLNNGQTGVVADACMYVTWILQRSYTTRSLELLMYFAYLYTHCTYFSTHSYLTLTLGVPTPVKRICSCTRC